MFRELKGSENRFLFVWMEFLFVLQLFWSLNGRALAKSERALFLLSIKYV